MSNKHWKRIASLKDDEGKPLASLFEDKKGRRKAKARFFEGSAF